MRTGLACLMFTCLVARLLVFDCKSCAIYYGSLPALRWRSCRISVVLSVRSKGLCSPPAPPLHIPCSDSDGRRMLAQCQQKPLVCGRTMVRESKLPSPMYHTQPIPPSCRLCCVKGGFALLSPSHTLSSNGDQFQYAHSVTWDLLALRQQTLSGRTTTELGMLHDSKLLSRFA
jgi:hypothetical protein